MSEQIDQSVWSGLERRLAAVEPFIPPTPGWRTEHDPVGATPARTLLRPVVRPRRTTRDWGNRRATVLLFVALAVALALVAGALLVGIGRQPAPQPSIVAPSPGAHLSLVATGSMAFGREGHSATLMDNGLVLISGGVTGLRWAELYDPQTGTFQQTGEMAPGAEADGSTLLLDGRVLVFGDRNPIAQIYDPWSRTFKLASSNLTQGWSHVATRLLDGRVLLAGSKASDPISDSATSAELFEPGTEQFSLTGSMTHPQPGATGTLLQDGRVLIVGISGSDSTAELFALPGHFGPTGALHVARQQQAAVRLQDGRVLVVGGIDPRSNVALGSAEIYDPATGTFQVTGAMEVARINPSATLLPDGRVLVSGGGWAGASGLSRSTRSEIYDPATGRFSYVPSSVVLPYLSSATLLPGGDVLIAGGWSDNFGPLLNKAYLFDYRAVPKP